MKASPQDENIVPFGKYKDQPVEALLADSGYLEWVLNQPALVELLKRRWPGFYDTITLGSIPQDSPAHNKLQAEFLNRGVQLALLQLITGKEPLARYASWRERQNQQNIRDYEQNIESFKGRSDFAEHLQELLRDGPRVESEELPIELSFEHQGFDVQLEVRSLRIFLSIELKPLMGDDYPSVLRQIKRQQLVKGGSHGEPCLVIETFHSAVCTLEQVRGIFAPIKIVTMAEINQLLS